MVEVLARDLPQQGMPKNQKAFFGIFVVSFAVFLAIALCAQLLTLQWRTWLPGAEGEKSLIGGVKAAVDTFMPYLT